MTKRKNLRRHLPKAGSSLVLEEILGCKWSVVVLRNIAAGVSRPGALTRAISGISAKVLNERLRKLLRYEIITRKHFKQIPPRVEYRLTPIGRRLAELLCELDELEVEINQS